MAMGGAREAGHAASVFRPRVGPSAKSASGKRGIVGAEVLQRRNAKLEREVAVLFAELDAARRRAETAEEAEERLCMQLGEAEVEAVELARAYQGRVDDIARELARAYQGSRGRAAPTTIHSILGIEGI
ncbi:hypothetical protein PR202_ga16053 [Eleusine coracana subsp. coracana]|uniref:Uncharacterized protein n=1 Tax=Eleusine coracana subsp. coracana TaxID=191504 RepID=A0AAV5CLN9_ELECO|nr:hypothetical protein PR202_ga16053 [Eleusine coracana subsp. coracana]